VVRVLVGHEADSRTNPSLFVVGEGSVDQFIAIMEFSGSHFKRLIRFNVPLVELVLPYRLRWIGTPGSTHFEGQNILWTVFGAFV
jgi:hypothetical protein